MMNNELTTTGTALAPIDSSEVSLLEMRKNSVRYPRLCRIDRAQAVHDMTRIVHQAFMYKGHNADHMTLQFLASALVDELVADPDRIGTKWISMAEIARVVKRAVLTKEDLVTISVSSLYKVIVEYVKGEGHQLERDIRDGKAQTTDNNPMVLAYAAKLARRK